MNIDSLKQPWQDQATPPCRIEPAELLAATVKRSRQFDRATRKRTLIGMAMFLLPVPLLVFLFFVFPGNSVAIHLVGAGLLLFMLLCAALIARTGILKGTATVAPDQNVERYLVNQLRKIGKQAWLFRNIIWWFWTPLLGTGVVLALVMLFTSLVPVNQYDLFSIVLLPVMSVYGIRSARKYLEREIQPWQREFEDCLHTLQDRDATN